MKQELIRTTRRVGTSAGVILPIKLLGAVVKISVIEEPINPLLDSIKILKKHKLSSEILAIGLTGSHARIENEIGSDVDILIITEKTTKTIEEGKYSLTLISEKELKKSLEKNPIYYLPMIYEAIPLINPPLLEKYKKHPIKKETLNEFIGDTQKTISNAKKMIEIDEKLNNKNTGDSIAYSLILRFRSLYSLQKMLLKKKISKKDFKKIVNPTLYNIYLDVKKGKMKNRTPIKEAKETIKQIEKLLKKYG